MDKDSKQHKIVLRRCDGYDREALVSHVQEIVGTLVANCHFHGKVVMLKPNLISSRSPVHGCTNAQFIAAVAQWFREQGAKVRLGDSPAFGSVHSVCEQQGILGSLDELGVELTRFRTPVARILPCGVAVSVARESLECDLLVGLPKLKAHNQLFVTMAVKNLFGVIVGARKAMLHMTHGADHDSFAQILLGLQSLYPKQLHILDGIEVMHKSGPLDGEPLRLNLIGGAISPVALDTAMLQVLELNAQQSPVYRVAAQTETRAADPSNFLYPFLEPEECSVSEFIAPATLNPVRFNPVRFVRGLIKRATLKVVRLARISHDFFD